jgi:hypothetical protein
MRDYQEDKKEKNKDTRSKIQEKDEGLWDGVIAEVALS